jgi:hypothetical protein
MRRRVGTAALSVLVGALWASGASAAAPTTSASKSPPAGDYIANLNLGGAVTTALAQDAPSLRPNVVSITRGMQLGLAPGCNWDP